MTTKTTSNSENPDRSDFNKNELLDFYKHTDKILSNKENLFIPLSISPFALIITKWGEIELNGLIIAWIISFLIYGYHILITVKFGHFQDNTFNKIYEIQGGTDKSQFADIVKPKNSKKLFDFFKSVRKLRLTFFAILNIIWIIVIFMNWLNFCV